MKKTLTLALSVLLVMALAIPSFAGWIQEEAYYEIALSVNKAATAWAADGVKWAVENGIYEGQGSVLNPTSPASRALVATMLTNYVNAIA